jgi:hypothetical protein
MIHEDLNRVLDRKYVEIPDPGDRPDAEVSAELWELHRKRNDSVVVDTVSGVYKSTITCPKCKTPWRKFDPFNSIELPLPIKSSRALRVMVMKRNANYAGSGKKKKYDNDGNEIDTVPIVYSMEITKDTRMINVAKRIEQLSGIPCANLIFWESWKGRIFQFLVDPHFEVYRLASGDMVVASEIPDVKQFALKDDVRIPVKQIRGEGGVGGGGGEEAEEGGEGVIQFILCHRYGKDQGAKGIRGLNMETASEFFGEPMFVCARKSWSLSHFKRHVLAQMLYVLKPPDYNEDAAAAAANKSSKSQKNDSKKKDSSSPDICEFDDEFLISLSDSLLVGELISEKGFAKTSVNRRSVPLAPSYYQSIDPNLSLGQLFPASDEGITYVALEWNERNVAYVRHSLQHGYPHHEHPTVRQYLALEAPMSLDQCFNLYCSDELMEAGEDFYCKNCMDHVGGCVKSMRLTRCPEVLIVTLKRFGQQMRRSGYCFPDKLQDMVEFPLDGFDIAPYILPSEGAAAAASSQGKGSSPRTRGRGAGGGGASPANGNNSTIYDLFGSVNHYGHATFGHYRAFVRGGEWQDNASQQDSWYQFDDDSVKEVRSSDVISNVSDMQNNNDPPLFFSISHLISVCMCGKVLFFFFLLLCRTIDRSSLFLLYIGTWYGSSNTQSAYVLFYRRRPDRHSAYSQADV